MTRPRATVTLSVHADLHDWAVTYGVTPAQAPEHLARYAVDRLQSSYAADAEQLLHVASIDAEVTA